MKRLLYLLVAVLVVMILVPIGSVFAQKSLLQVQLTYSGDTDKTILRRVQWIEAAKKEGALVWWGSTTPDEAKKFIEAFNKIYPFIKVDFWRGSGEETAAKLDAGFAGGIHVTDVCLGAEWVYLPRWRKIGLFEKFTEILPGIEKMDKGMYSAHGDWALAGNNGVVPTYNTKQVSAAEAPKSWNDLINPKWKGQLGLTTDIKLWSVLALAEGGWGVEKTEEFLKRIKQQEPIWARGHREGYSLMIAGEFKILADAYIRYTFDTKQPGDTEEVTLKIIETGWRAG